MNTVSDAHGTRNEQYRDYMDEDIALIPGDLCLVDLSQGDCFNIDACCDKEEKALIATLRAYLRPEQAPECLMNRLRHCLDEVCGQSATNTAQTATALPVEEFVEHTTVHTDHGSMTTYTHTTITHL